MDSGKAAYDEGNCRTNAINRGKLFRYFILDSMFQTTSDQGICSEVEQYYSQSEDCNIISFTDSNGKRRSINQFYIRIMEV